MTTTTTPRAMAIALARKLERAARHQARRADLAGKPNLVAMYKTTGASDLRDYMQLRMVYATHAQQTA